MIVSIASGKGGTGKTTVATNLAYALGKGVQFLDCDVEAPNAHLFLNPRLVKTETVFLPVPQIDLQKCTTCGECARICRFRAIAVAGQTVLTFPELCHSCGGCQAVCPENAIVEVGRELGVIESGQSNGIEFVHGRLRIGEAMSPPLIKMVRERAQSFGTILIDAPPGTSCPVIAAMRGVDAVLLVTEPTPFGLHDLKLAVAAVRQLGIPAGLVINRSDGEDASVQQYAEREKVPVLMRIPFQRTIAEAYSRGELMLTKFPAWQQPFVALHAALSELASTGVR